MIPTDMYLLFQMAENKNMSVGILLSGEAIPLQQMELELYQTYVLAKARLEQQANKNK